MCFAIWMVLKMKIIDFSYEGFSGFSFLVRYPEYVLGMLLYYKVREQKKDGVRKYLFIGLILFVFVVITEYINLLIHEILSGWLTSLSTYFIIYYLIHIENYTDFGTIGGR